MREEIVMQLLRRSPTLESYQETREGAKNQLFLWECTPWIKITKLLDFLNKLLSFLVCCKTFSSLP